MADLYTTPYSQFQESEYYSYSDMPDSMATEELWLHPADMMIPASTQSMTSYEEEEKGVLTSPDPAAGNADKGDGKQQSTFLTKLFELSLKQPSPPSHSHTS